MSTQPCPLCQTPTDNICAFCDDVICLRCEVKCNECSTSVCKPCATEHYCPTCDYAYCAGCFTQHGLDTCLVFSKT